MSWHISEFKFSAKYTEKLYGLKKQLYWEWTTQKQQGFRTSESRFVSRREAFKIAKAAWQLRVVDWNTGEVIDWKERLDVLGENDLYSEDLR